MLKLVCIKIELIVGWTMAHFPLGQPFVVVNHRWSSQNTHPQASGSWPKCMNTSLDGRYKQEG